MKKRKSQERFERLHNETCKLAERGIQYNNGQPRRKDKKNPKPTMLNEKY